MAAYNYWIVLTQKGNHVMSDKRDGSRPAIFWTRKEAEDFLLGEKISPSQNDVRIIKGQVLNQKGQLL